MYARVNRTNQVRFRVRRQVRSSGGEREASMKRRIVALSVLVSFLATSSCADRDPGEAPSAPERAEAAGPLVYVPATDPLCTDDDPSGAPYAGPPTNAGPRPTWTQLDIQHPADMLDDDNEPSTPDIHLRQLPDYRNISHNLNFLQSLRFMISIVTRLTSGLENAQTYLEEGQYADAAMTWVNGQIPQTVGHCLCVGSCAPGGCNPQTILGNVESVVDEIMNNLHFDTLLQEFLQEKIDATIADLSGLKAYFEGRFTAGYLTDVLGQALKNALTTEMEAAVAQFAGTVTACEPLVNAGDPNFGPLHVDIDAAVQAAMAQLEAEFQADIAAIQSVIQLYNDVGAALPTLKVKAQALLAQFQGVQKLTDLFNVNWQDVAAKVQDLADAAQTLWPSIESVINQDWAGFWDDIVNFPARIQQLANDAYDDVINALLSSPNASACITAILDSGSYLNPGLYDFSDFVANLKVALKVAVQAEWADAKAQIQQVLTNLQNRINGIGEDALAFVKTKLDQIKNQILSAATAGCYMRGYRSECYDFCGTTNPASAQECFLWLPADFLQQPAATAASAGMFVLQQTGFLDELVEWMDQHLTAYLTSKLGALANVLGTLNETLQKIHDIFFDVFAYIDRFSEGYHLGGYSALRPDLHMCVGYAGHGAYAQMGNLGGDKFSIGARYSSHNLSKKHRVQFRSGGFAVSAFGYDLSLLPGIEINTQIHGFELWDIRRPLGIPLNVTISPETLARLDIFNTLPPDNSPNAATSPFGLIIDQGNGLPLGAAIVRDLWPVRDAANQVVWPRPDVSDVITPANTPGAPAWESDSTAVVSLGVNLPIDVDPPKKYLVSIPIIPGILQVIPYFDIAFGVEWKHEVDLYLTRILEKVNQNLPTSDQLGPDDLRRPMHAVQGDDLTADDGTAIYVEPEIGFDLFLGFKIWKIRIGAYASLGLAVNIRPGGHGGVVDLNSALADALLHSNPPADAPCTPIWQTTLHEGCNSVLTGGDADAEYSCEPSEAGNHCCIHLFPTYPDGVPAASNGYWGCVDDWTGIDAQLCKDINGGGKSAEEVIKALPQVPAPVGPWLIARIADLADFVGQTQGASGLAITATWGQGVSCADSDCGNGKGTLLSTSILDVQAISECAQHGSCTWSDGTVKHDLTEADCFGAVPGDPAATAPTDLYKAIDIGELVCALVSSTDPTKDGRVRCWTPGPNAAPLIGSDAPSTVPGKSAIECDSNLCGWTRPNSLDPNTSVAPFIYSLDAPQGCGVSGSFADCSHHDGPTYDIAVGPEGATSLNGAGALRYDDNGKCPSPFDPSFPSGLRSCQTNFLVQRLACGNATPPANTGVNVNIPANVCNATFKPERTLLQVEYDDLTMCGIVNAAQVKVVPVDTPIEERQGGPIACAVARMPAAPFGPVPGNPASCAGVACDDTTVCQQSATMPPTCVLPFTLENHTLSQPWDGWDFADDFVDVAAVGNQVVCGIHAGSPVYAPLSIQCGNLSTGWWNGCKSGLLLDPPAGAFRDIEPAGVCTMCALSLDGAEIVCWGDEVGQGQAVLAAPQDDPFQDMGGLSSMLLGQGSTYKVCGVTQSGHVSCNDSTYEPYPREVLDPAGNPTGAPPIFTPYQCHTIQDTAVTGWQGDGCHPLQHGFASACGCATDDDCAGGEICGEGRCAGAGGPVSCECGAGGSCPSGRVCSGGACALACGTDADCASNAECRPDGTCGPKHGIPYAEVITWGMSNVPAPMHTINSYAMSDILATLILKFSVGVEASFKLFGKAKTWKIFEFADSWDLGSTWKGWYQPGLEARYQDECADPDLQTTMTNRFPRSLTSNPYDAAFNTAGVSLQRNCPNGGVCRYKAPLPASQSQPWQYTAGNVGTVEEFVLWCKDDMPQHQENPPAATPEDLMDGVADTYNFGANVGFAIYAQSQPCIDGQPVTSWLADLMPTTDAAGNVTDEGLLGTKDCIYDDPQTGQTHTFPCSDITANMMRVWGCLDRTKSPYAQYLWDKFPELRHTQDPGGAPHDWLDVDVMFWPTPGSALANDYSPQTMKTQYRYYTKMAGFFPLATVVGEKWLNVASACFDQRYYDADETRCECATDADCNADRGEVCGGQGCMEPHLDPATGATQLQIKECPMVAIDLGVEQCCGDGVVQSEPVQIIAPADPQKDPELYAAHGCSDPSSEDPVCKGLYYVEECDGGPNGSATCSTECKGTQPAGGPNACCVPGACFENLTDKGCKLQGGVFHPGVDCASLDYCEDPTGCTPGTVCDDGDPCTVEDRCSVEGCHGTPLSCDDANPCTTDVCVGKEGCAHTPIPGCGLGACCLPQGLCIDMDATKCGTGGGTFTPGASCAAGFQCKVKAACCFPSGICKDVIAEECVAGGGTSVIGATCATPGICVVPPAGACCLPDGSCKALSHEECQANKGAWSADGDCGQKSWCFQLGACCTADGGCLELDAPKCIEKGGLWEPGHTCEASVGCGGGGSLCGGEPDANLHTSLVARPGVELSGPSVGFAAPKAGTTVYAGDLGTADVVALVTVSGATLGGDGALIAWYLDGKQQKVADTADPFVFKGLAPGDHQLAVQLTGPEGAFTNLRSKAVLHISVLQKCKTSADCDDKKVCSLDTCVKGICRHAAMTGCCENALDCPLGAYCVANQCVACLGDADCNDGNTCTGDCCGEGGVCWHEALPGEGCCFTNMDCDDGSVCSIDRCVDNKCQYALVANELCCNTSADCPDVPCQLATCSGDGKRRECRYAPIKGCCLSNKDCNDNDRCTADVCDLATHACKKPTLMPGCCATAKDCDDGNPCTKESCRFGKCLLKPIAGCCPPGQICQSPVEK